MINQSLVPKDLSGTLITLPLIFEFTVSLTTFQDSHYSKFFTILPFSQVTTFLSTYSGISGRCPLFPVLNRESNAIVYIPMLVSSSRFSVSSSDIAPESIDFGYTYGTEFDRDTVGFPTIYFKSPTYSQYIATSSSFIAFSHYNKPGKFHSIPQVESFSFATHLRTQIYTRYYKPPTITDHQDFTTVLDSFLPYLALESVSNYLSNIQDNPSSYCAISPLTADLLNINRLPLSTILTRILGYSLADLTDLFNTVRSRKFTILFAGTGGTGINTICWLSEIATLLQISNLFDEIHLFERDYVDFSNIFRFPLPLSTYTSPKVTEMPKIGLIQRQVAILSDIVYTHDQFIESISDIPSIMLKDDKLVPNTVIYGAPSVSNRNFLSSLGSFVSATHANNTASLYANPIADETLQVETYGLIQLNSFFINQISMAIGFLEMLATDTHLAHDHHYADYTFTTNISANFNFQIDTELTATPIPDNN